MSAGRNSPPRSARPRATAIQIRRAKVRNTWTKSGKRMAGKDMRAPEARRTLAWSAREGNAACAAANIGGASPVLAPKRTAETLVFLIGVALLGLVAFGLGWALLGNMAGTLLVTFAWFGTEFDRFLTGFVIVGPALGAVCMVAAIWFALRASGRCRTRREMMRGTAAALAIILGLGGAAGAADAVRMELYKARYNLILPACRLRAAPPRRDEGSGEQGWHRHDA